MLRLLLVALGIYLIAIGTTKKYLAFPCGLLGAALIQIGVGI
jgi:hypothetical protein